MNATRAEETAPRSAPVPKQQDPIDERPFAVIVTDLWEKTEALVRQEMRLGITEAEEKVELLKVELKDEVAKLKVELVTKAIGGAVAAVGGLALVAALIMLLAEVMPPWLAALLVGVVAAGAGVLMLKKPMRVTPELQPRQLVPQRTVDSLRTDARTVKEAMK